MTDGPQLFAKSGLTPSERSDIVEFLKTGITKKDWDAFKQGIYSHQYNLRTDPVMDTLETMLRNVIGRMRSKAQMYTSGDREKFVKLDNNDALRAVLFHMQTDLIDKAYQLKKEKREELRTNVEGQISKYIPTAYVQDGIIKPMDLEDAKKAILDWLSKDIKYKGIPPNLKEEWADAYANTLMALSKAPANISKYKRYVKGRKETEKLEADLTASRQRKIAEQEKRLQKQREAEEREALLARAKRTALIRPSKTEKQQIWKSKTEAGETIKVNSLIHVDDKSRYEVIVGDKKVMLTVDFKLNGTKLKQEVDKQLESLGLDEKTTGKISWTIRRHMTEM